VIIESMKTIVATGSQSEANTLTSAEKLAISTT